MKHPPRSAVRFVALFVLGCAASCGDGKTAAPPTPASSMTDAEYVRRFHAGVVELEQHRFLDAAKTFGELTKDRPRNLAAWINLAEAELNRNTPESHPAVEAAVAGALAVDPEDPQAHFIRGILHKHLGEFEQAEARFRAALKKAPEDPTLNYQLATVLPPERSEEAIVLLETCLAGQTHLSSAYYRLAEVKLALADPAQQHLPVLTLALEAGFGSIGPFNRAFKADTGLTPTDFRRLKLADS